MKKSILIFVSIIGISFCASAQEYANDFRTNLQFGVKAGINYANVYDAEGEEFNADFKLGYVAGVFAAIPIGRFFGFHPEILYSQKGFKATGRILGNPYEFKRTTTYVDVPLLFAVKPSGFLTLLAGPQYSYLISQKDVFENGITSIAQEEEFENDNIRKNTFGFLGGIDINLNHFVLGARIAWDITNNNGDGTSTTPRYKNVVYQATLGYRFYSN